MIFVRTLTLFCFLVVITVSCKTDTKKETDKTPEISDVSVENLDQELFASKSVQDVQIFLNKHPYLTPLYFTDTQADTAQLANHLFNILQNPGLQEFKTRIDTIIGDRTLNIVNPLKEAFANIRESYPDFKSPKIKFIITGFTGNDLYISDSLIIIGLDYFGGPKAGYRPDVFDYQLRRYQKEYIVPSVIFFLSNQYNHLNATDPTLLSEMVGYGKGFEFVKQVLPNTPDSLILGYSSENLSRTYNSQQDIWAYFITNKLLYEKNELKKQKYIGERPFTTEIGNQVPGGIGRWVGWRIVSMFMEENPDLTLPELMKMDNAMQILQESGYKGQRDEEN
ncbi:gliding motility protein GldB-related protein [Dyadobacter psychrotolerans]|uniref:Gliding motility protein n=1 Tax=Dyadobacter psychrotolerans TaxID=2541721 RepID=A0A4R5DEV8_9BACT|nr:gliding motility protein [Dyadobacter psychrotolerans]TDE12442.1 gliding motility protein [Dyadobacter psychrotolerans]